MSSSRSISRAISRTSLSQACTLNAYAHVYSKSPAFRRLLSTRILSLNHEAYLKSSQSATSAPLPFLRSQFLPCTIRPSLAPQLRPFHDTSQDRQDVRSESKSEGKARTGSAKDQVDAEDIQAKTQEDPKEKEEGSEKKAEGEKAEGEEGEGENKDGKKEDLPPPPPHGDKTPWQVFMETMQTEFKASKEWNDSTKQLAQGATDFVESDSVRRAREAYEKTTGAVSSTAGAVLKNTAGAVGKGAAWTWDTPVMKGVRKVANVTGEALDKSTKPIRDTEAFKSVKSVIDDGSSSRYGGWVDKEERKRQRELREQMDGIKRHEVIEEDPKYVHGSFLPLFLS